MVDLNFITANPALQTFQAGQRMSADREDRDLRRQQTTMAIDDSQRRRSQEDAASAALQGIYAPREKGPAADPGGSTMAAGRGTQLAGATTETGQASMPVARPAGRVSPEAFERASAAPGLSSQHRMQFLGQAETLRNRGEQQRERAAQNMVAFLKIGAVDEAKRWAREAGINGIPDTFWTDQDAQRKLLQQLEIDNKRADIAQKNARAEYWKQGGAARGGQDPARIREANILVERGVFPDFNTAYGAVRSQVTPSGEQIRLKGLSWLNSQKDEGGMLRYRTPEQQAAALGAYELFAKGDTAGALERLRSLDPQKPQDDASLFTGLWRSLTGAGAAPAAPSPAAAGPAPPAAAPGAGPAERPALASPAQPAAAANPGTRESPATPQTEADFAALPSGAIYRDPDDGQLYAKP